MLKKNQVCSFHIIHGICEAWCSCAQHFWADAQLRVVLSGIKRVEVFIRLSLSLERQQASGPLRHAQIISAPRHMHSNSFIIYFIIIPWLQFEADRFIIHDRQPFDSWAFSFALLYFTIFFFCWT